jgi:hypothetical protein
VEAGIAAYRDALQQGFFASQGKQGVVDLRPFARRLDAVPFVIYHHLRARAAETGVTGLVTHPAAAAEGAAAASDTASEAGTAAAESKTARAPSRSGAAGAGGLREVMSGRGLVLIVGNSAVPPKDAILFTGWFALFEPIVCFC